MLGHSGCGVGLHGEVLIPECPRPCVPHAIPWSAATAAYQLRGYLHSASPAQDRHGVGGGPTAATLGPDGLRSCRARFELGRTIRSAAHVLCQPLIVLDRLGFRAPARHSCRSTGRTAVSSLMPAPSGRSKPYSGRDSLAHQHREPDRMRAAQRRGHRISNLHDGVELLSAASRRIQRSSEGNGEASPGYGALLARTAGWLLAISWLPAAWCSFGLYGLCAQRHR